MGTGIRRRLPGVRDQGPRPTCLSFAVSAAHAFRASSKARYEPLSEEMLHWGASSIGKHAAGISVPSADAALARFGQCLHELWPYTFSPARSDPSDEALNDGMSRLARLEPANHDAESVMSLIQGEVPIVLVLPVCEEFFAAHGGLIRTPAAEAVMQDLHAVLATDVADIHSFGRAIEFRNSWGTDWGDEGYGYVLPDYVDQYCVAAVRLVSG